jgi:hypothetical protein
MKRMTLEEFEKTYGVAPPINNTGDESKTARASRGFLAGMGVGALKSVGETALGAGQLGQSILQSTVGRGVEAITGADRTEMGVDMFQPERAQEIRDTTLRADAPGEGTGKFLGTLAQYALPTGSIVRGQQALGAVAKQVPTTFGRMTAQAGARFAPEAVGTGAIGAVRSGGDMEQAKTEALFAGGASVGLGALGSLARTTYFPELKQSVAKAFGIQGKMSGGQALEEVNKKIAGLGVLKSRASNLKVTLEDGTTAVFDPKKATYSSTLQAWNHARKNVFEEYTSLASKAGQKADVDISRVLDGLNETIRQPGLSIYKNSARSLMRDIDNSFDDLTKASIQDVETFVQALNKQTVNSFFKGTSDSAVSEVNASTARVLRELLDDVITSSQGSSYQGLRSQYGALKSIENDLVRKFQQEARKVGGGLPEYAGMFASGDIIGSVLTGNLTGVARGTTVGTLATLKRKLSNPERFLRRSFELLDTPESNQFIQRLFGSADSIR